MTTQLEDNYRHKGMRKQLVDTLRSKGITDEAVLAAIGEVPRHVFLDSSFVELAYQDQAFPIGSGQTISQPHTVAFQTQLLQVGKGMKVLEIGTGSGYQACVLAAMGAKVFSIEQQRHLYFKTKTSWSCCLSALRLSRATVSKAYPPTPLSIASSSRLARPTSPRHSWHK